MQFHFYVLDNGIFEYILCKRSYLKVPMSNKVLSPSLLT